MPIAKIPLTAAGLFTNVDQAAVSQQHVALFDGYVDELGYINRRPCLTQFVDLGTNSAVDGLFWWTEQRQALAVSNGSVYTLAEGGTASSIGSGLNAGQTVSFINCNPGGTHTVVMANGGSMYKTTGASVSQITDANAPANVKMVTFLDRYILANNSNSPYFYWSDVNDPDSWSATSFATAETKPDDVTGLMTNWDEVYILGVESIEVWYNDGVAPFVPRQGAAINRGTISPYTFQRVGNTFLYLDSTRHVVQLNGRNPQIVSNEIDKQLSTIKNIEDSFASVIDIEGRAFYVLSFKSENISYAYDYKLKTWARWGQFLPQRFVYNRFLGNAHCYAIDWNKHLVGSKDDGKIYTLTTAANKDGSDNVRLRVQTGHIDHGTLRLKKAGHLRFRGKRGTTNTGSTMALRYRDDGEGQWSEELEMSTGDIGDREIVYEIYLGGFYKTRQYEIIGTGDVPMLFGEAEEEVEMMAF